MRSGLSVSGSGNARAGAAEPFHGQARRRWRSSRGRPRRTGRGPARRRRPPCPPSGPSRGRPSARRRSSGRNRTTLTSTAPTHSSRLGPVEAEAGEDLGVAPFLEPDHPLGVGPVERLVEDLAVDGADGVGREDQPGRPPPGHGRRLPPGQVRRVIGRRRPGRRVGLVDVGGIDLEGVARLGQQLPAPGRGAGQDQGGFIGSGRCTRRIAIRAERSRSYATGPLPTRRKATHPERSIRRRLSQSPHSPASPPPSASRSCRCATAVNLVALPGRRRHVTPSPADLVDALPRPTCRRPRSRSGRSGSAPGSRSSWSRASRWWQTRSPSTGAPTAGSGCVEMGDYPLGVDGKGKPGGVVRILEDTDGDGRYDKATTFLDGLRFPTGVLPWRNGVLVASRPTSSTPRTATATARPTIARCSSPASARATSSTGSTASSSGLDGWVYGANGDSGGTVRSLKTGEDGEHPGPRLPVPARHGRVRGRERPDPVRPAPRRLGQLVRQQQPQPGPGITSWPSPDLRRNPHYAPPDPRQMLEPDTRLYPVSRTLARFNDPDAANHVTSANSPTPYRDDLFGPEFATSLFVSEPVHNLVHRMVLEPDGATYRGVARPGRGRPRVPRLERQLVPADDAQDRPRRRALDRRHVPRRHRAPRVDPRRRPEADRPPRRQRARGGSTASSRSTRRPGRSPGSTGSTPPAWSPRSTAPAAGSATRPSGCSCIARRARPLEPLRRLARTTGRPQTRVQAIAALASLRWAGRGDGTCRPSTTRIRRSAGSPSRRPRACSRMHPQLAQAVLRRVDDPDPHVRLQLATSLGDWNDPRAGQALASADPATIRRSAGSGPASSARRSPTWRRCSAELSRGGGDAPAGGDRAPRRAGGLDPGPRDRWRRSCVSCSGRRGRGEPRLLAIRGAAGAARGRRHGRDIRSRRRMRRR